MTIEGARCIITSSVVLPNGVERVVSMAGELSHEVGSTAKLGKVGGGGPFALQISEMSAARTLLMRELNTTTGEVALASSLMLTEGREEGDTELVLTSHELGEGGRLQGVQMWRMRRGEDDAAAEDDGWQDEEAFMTSGSEL